MSMRQNSAIYTRHENEAQETPFPSCCCSFPSFHSPARAARENPAPPASKRTWYRKVVVR